MPIRHIETGTRQLSVAEKMTPQKQKLSPTNRKFSTNLEAISKKVFYLN